VEVAINGIAAAVFSWTLQAKAAEPDLKSLHASIGQLTLEKEFETA
jgi:hypothetical protein